MAKGKITLQAAILAGVAGFAISGTGSSAWAQDRVSPAADQRDAGQIDDIIVTANKREQSLRDIAASVSALSEAQLAKQGIDNFERLSLTVPGLTTNTFTKNRATFDIRGVSTYIFGANTQDPVAIYINDAPVTDTYGAAVVPDLRLFDVSRVEVLRGPQGTLYGSGALAGVVRIVTNKPQMNEYGVAGRVDIGVTKGGALRQRYDAMVNIPLATDTLALRAVAYYRDEEGYVRNLNLGTKNNAKDWGVRAALLWTPEPDTNVKLESFYQQSKPEDSDGWDPKYGRYVKSSYLAEPRPAKFANVNLVIDHRFSGLFTLSSSSTYMRTDTAYYADGGLIPGLGEFVIRFTPWVSKVFTQEVRAVSDSSGPLSWVAGATYVNRDVNILFDSELVGINAVFGGALGSDTYSISNGLNKISDLGAYFDATYALTDAFKVFGGIRPFKTKMTFGSLNGKTLNFVTGTYDVRNFTNKSSDSGVTWRVGTSYQASPDALVYGSVSTGYRAGQTNPNIGASAINPNDVVIKSGYGSDRTLNYEIGSRVSLADHRLEFSAALYYIDWKDIQLNFRRLSDFAAYIDNSGNAVSKGLEIEATARPSRALQLGGSLTLQDSKIKSIDAASSLRTGVTKGDRLPGSIKNKYSAYVQYNIELAPSFDSFARVSASHVGGSPNFFAKNPGGVANPNFARNESYENVDLLFGVNHAAWSLELYAENLTNNHSYILNAGPVTPNPIVSLRPRTIGARLTFRP